MTPQIPGYVLTFESIVRPLVAIIALALIWLGAARMPASAPSRYATAGVLSAVLIGWMAVAQYLGAANTYFAAKDTVQLVVVEPVAEPLQVGDFAAELLDELAPQARLRFLGRPQPTTRQTPTADPLAAARVVLRQQVSAAAHQHAADARNR